MRTYYPDYYSSTNGCNYIYQLVDSPTFHAIHYDGKRVGVTKIIDEDVIKWYTVDNALSIYSQMRDAKKHKKSIDSILLKKLAHLPSTLISVKNFSKEFKNIKETVMANPILGVSSRGLQDTKINEKQNVKETIRNQIYDNIKQLANSIADDILKELPDVIKSDINDMKEIPNDFTNGLGVKLHVCQKESTCMFMVALGYNSTSISNVIYYSLKSAPNDVYVILNADIQTYKEWINSPSLGKYYNTHIKGTGKLLKALAK